MAIMRLMTTVVMKFVMMVFNQVITMTMPNIKMLMILVRRVMIILILKMMTVANNSDDNDDFRNYYGFFHDKIINNKVTIN